MENFKDIHIGSLVHKRVNGLDIQMLRICQFLKCTEKEVEEMYQLESLDTAILLKWSKLLEYDFFRIYSQHLILYAPPSSSAIKQTDKGIPQFRKKIYTKEIIDFVLELVESKEKTIQQIIQEYRIPKTTIYKWTKKYKKD
ncbi:helix-turn-helix resolvase-like protein [Chryseobacterium sp. 52]|uniref:helix-turn-helix domain-containing protein n=1 Tax=Chryseobacterium sp. 52 TaxID=2035213 RepID=UPI000C1A37D3|nr:helix-turn-helix domain-containing protein [Chryseobacterium sp. 52]PIF47636.1 helix-turn-helix resolvase-like protein [Chryseobacterium sp. 52]